MKCVILFVSVRVNMHHLQFKMILILSYTGGLVETPVHPLMIKARPLRWLSSDWLPLINKMFNNQLVGELLCS